MACEIRDRKLRGYALDTIQKLIAYGYLNGNTLADPKVRAVLLR